ncbi:MAG: hypothetical protein LGB70_08865, partial [Sulfurovum sp.]|nr:hypothetical protein [Sulfurovum sp.]
THTHTWTCVSHGNGTEEKVCEKRQTFKEELKDLTEAAIDGEKRGVGFRYDFGAHQAAHQKTLGSQRRGCRFATPV